MINWIQEQQWILDQLVIRLMGTVKKEMDKNRPKEGTRLSLVIYNFETCYIKVD